MPDVGDCQFFIGKDDETLWVSNPLTLPSKTKSKNIIKILPGPKRVTRGLSNELGVFLTFITLEMIVYIVHYTNLYIEDRKNKVQFSRERDCTFTT